MPQSVRIGLQAALIMLVIAFFGGVAVIHHAELRGYDAAKLSNHGHLFLLSLGVAFVVGALVVAWRLINPKDAQWGAALVVAAVLLFGALVWPTPWVYTELGCKVFRVNRLFGTRQEVTELPACGKAAAYDRGGS